MLAQRTELELVARGLLLRLFLLPLACSCSCLPVSPPEGAGGGEPGSVSSPRGLPCLWGGCLGLTRSSSATKSCLHQHMAWMGMRARARREARNRSVKTVASVPLARYYQQLSLAEGAPGHHYCLVSEVLGHRLCSAGMAFTNLHPPLRRG